MKRLTPEQKIVAVYIPGIGESVTMTPPFDDGSSPKFDTFIYRQEVHAETINRD